MPRNPKDNADSPKIIKLRTKPRRKRKQRKVEVIATVVVTTNQVMKLEKI